MADEILPYGRQWIDDDDVEAVVAALRGDYLTTGPRVADFEAALAQAVGAEHAIAVAVADIARESGEDGKVRAQLTLVRRAAW